MKREIITGLISISAGCLILIFRKSLAKKTIEAQNVGWGINIGEKDIAITMIIIIVVGIGFIFFGLMGMGLF